MGAFFKMFYYYNKSWIKVLFVVEIHEVFCCKFLAFGGLRFLLNKNDI